MHIVVINNLGDTQYSGTSEMAAAMALEPGTWFAKGATFDEAYKAADSLRRGAAPRNRVEPVNRLAAYPRLGRYLASLN